MKLFGRRRQRPGTTRTASVDDARHLEAFVASRSGVEAFVEPRTTITETTVMLVAADGEWTRRRVAGPEGAAAFARKAGVPLYDVQRVGYPQRMRDYNARRKKAGGAPGADVTERP